MSSYQAFSLLGIVASLLLSIFTYVRVGRWRETDEAKLLTGRVDKAEANIAGKAAISEVALIDRRVTTIEAKLEHVATKADIANLGAKLDGLGQLIVRAETAVERVEQFMMEKPR